jgi:hypothetical protein
MKGAGGPCSVELCARVHRWLVYQIYFTQALWLLTVLQRAAALVEPRSWQSTCPQLLLLVSWLQVPHMLQCYVQVLQR